jgi:hypothetical protein
MLPAPPPLAVSARERAKKAPLPDPPAVPVAYSEANALSEAEASGTLPAEVLTTCLAGAKTSERVLRLAEAHMARMNAIHVAAALDALGAIFMSRKGSSEAAAAFANDERTTALIELGAALAPQMSSRDLVACLRGCARLSHDPGTAFQAAWERAAVAGAARFRPRDVAGAAWCYGQLRLQAGPAWGSARDALYEALAPDMRPEELAAVYWGHGRLGVAPTRSSRVALGTAAAAACASGMLGAREVANVLWGAASWATPPVHGAGGGSAFGPPGWRLTAAWAEGLAASGTPRLREASAQELSNVAFAMARLGAAPERPWRDAFYAAFAVRLADRSATPQHLAATLYALSSLTPPRLGGSRGVPEVPPERWLAAFWVASKGALSRSSAQQVANTISAAARLRVLPPPEWLAAFWLRSAALLRGATATEVSSTLAAAAALDQQPPPAWQRALWTEGACYGLRGGTCAEVAQAAQALASLQLRPPERWMAEFANTASRSMASGEGRALEQLLLAFLALLPEEGLVSRAAAALPERILAEAQRRGQGPVAAVAVVTDECDETLAGALAPS